MKNLRRLMTLLLVVTMVFSSVGVFADEAAESVNANAKFSDIEAGSRVEKAVAKLVAYGIISGYPDGTFKPDGQITRAEFAAVITRFEGIANNLPSDSVTGFADLDNDTQNAWARPYVKAAVDAGIINGFDDGTFRAGEPVTYEQAIKMLICAIDYQIIADSELARLKATNALNITWSSGYIAAANKNSITVGAMTANITAPTTRGSVAILASNALEAPKLNVKDDGKVEKVDPSEDDEEKILKIEGTVTGTYLTALGEQAPDIEANEIRISSKNSEKEYELSENVLAETNLEDLLGKKVTAYYDNREGEITSITVESSNKVTLINEESIDRPIKGAIINYENSKGKTETVDLEDYDVIWNGKYIEDLPKMETAFRNGTIEIVDSGSKNVAKVTSYEVFVVNSYNKTDGKIFFKYGKTYDNGAGPENFYLFPKKTSEKPEIFVNGTKKDFSSLSLSAYNVINYMESPKDAEGEFIRRMYVTTGKKSGKVTAGLDDVREKELDGKIVYLTNDYLDYTPATGEEEKPPFTLGDSYSELYYDMTGQIAAAKYSATSSTGTYSYGYIVAVGENDSNVPCIRFMSKSGITTAYPLKNIVKIDGEKTPDDKVFDALEKTAKIANAAYNKVFNETIGECYQPVRYSLSGGSIEAIDTVESMAETVSANDNLTYDVSLADAAANSNKATTSTTKITVGSDVYAVNSSTVVFYVPNNRNDRSEYEYMAPSKAFSSTKERYVEVLGVDQTSANKLAKLVIVYRENPTMFYSGDSSYMIVTKIHSGGEQIEGYRNGSGTTTKVTVSDEKFYTNLSKNAVTASEVGKGDIIRYVLSNSKIVAIEMVYDASEKDFNYNNGKKEYDVWTAPGVFHVIYGEIIAHNEEDASITMTTLLKGVDEGDANKSAYTFSTSSVKIIELSGEEVNILEGFDSSIYNITTETPSRIFLITKDKNENAEARVIYVIR